MKNEQYRHDITYNTSILINTKIAHTVLAEKVPIISFFFLHLSTVCDKTKLSTCMDRQNTGKWVRERQI